MQPIKKQYNPIVLYLILTIFFFVLVALLPANTKVMDSYNVSPNEYHIMLFVVELPLAAIWLAAFYGYGKLKAYANSISKTKEGQGFNKLAEGSKWLAWGYILTSIVSLIANSIANRHHGFHDGALIISNYFALLFALLAFSFLASGAYRLLIESKIHLALSSVRLMVMTFVGLGAAYCYLTLSRLDLDNQNSTNNPYHLPVWIMTFTVIIPYLYAWCIGLLAAYAVSTVAKNAKGVLYRQSLQLLALGVVAVIASSIAVQYLHTAIPRISHISLNYVLLMTYIVYIFNVIGFLLISLGAIRLKKIEDI